MHGNVVLVAEDDTKTEDAAAPVHPRGDADVSHGGTVTTYRAAA